MHPWQHFSGTLLSGQSTDKSTGQTVKQSHFDLSSGQVNTRTLISGAQITSTFSKIRQPAFKASQLFQGKSTAFRRAPFSAAKSTEEKEK